jgi:hypothetical protein
MEPEIRENVVLEFKSNDFKFVEGSDGAWLTIGGVALTEGVSRNKNKYTFENLAENDGKEFKWLVGHPDEAEDHVVGKGTLMLEGCKLRHAGKIRNTARHPDIVESVRDGFLGPSIHASAKEVKRSKIGEEYVYEVKGLSIDGVGLVAFQGVKDASIDYALAESFEPADLKESSGDDEINKDTEENKMAEEEKPVEPETPEETPEEETTETPEEEEEKKEPETEAPEAEESAKKIAELEEQIAKMKNSTKEGLVDELCKMNEDFKKEELMKESEDQLKVRKEYEQKLAESSTEETAIVETDEAEPQKDEIVENNGIATLSEKAWRDFNKELKERI